MRKDGTRKETVIELAIALGSGLGLLWIFAGFVVDLADPWSFASYGSSLWGYGVRGGPSIPLALFLVCFLLTAFPLWRKWKARRDTPSRGDRDRRKDRRNG